MPALRRPPAPSSPPGPVSLQSPPPAADRSRRHLGRQVAALLALAAAAAFAGPIVSYRSDVAEARQFVRRHVNVDTGVYASTLARNLVLLQAELERLASRPEIDLLDERMSPEQALLDVAHHKSALFSAGVAIFDAQGQLVWSEPRELPALEHLRPGERWKKRLVGLRRPLVDVLQRDGSLFLVAVPILRGDQGVGAIAGLLDARGTILPIDQPVANTRLLVFDGAGEVLFPPDPPAFARERGWFKRFDPLFDSEVGSELELDGRRYYAAAAVIGQTRLRLALVADEEELLRPMRRRFLMQLLLVTLVQLAALLGLGLFVRRLYTRLLAVERLAVEQEKLAAMGTAASLIAHEVKNSLNGLNAASSSLLSGAAPELAAHALRGQVDRLRHLAGSLLEFGRPTLPQRSRASLGRLVSEVVEGLRSLPEAGEVQLQVDRDGEATVLGDPLLLISAVDNLVRNAIEAAAAAKDVGRTESPEVRIRIFRDGSHAVLTVEDNAGGVGPEVARRLFEPFVTGKPKGIGLGLAMADRAIREQGGTLNHVNIAGGSRFTLRMPLEDDADESFRTAG